MKKTQKTLGLATLRFKNFVTKNNNKIKIILNNMDICYCMRKKYFL